VLIAVIFLWPGAGNLSSVGALMLHGGHCFGVLISFPPRARAALMMLRGDDHKDIRTSRLLSLLLNSSSRCLMLRYVRVGDAGYRLGEFAHGINSRRSTITLGVDGISIFLLILTTF